MPGCPTPSIREMGGARRWCGGTMWWSTPRLLAGSWSRGCFTPPGGGRSRSPAPILTREASDRGASWRVETPTASSPARHEPVTARKRVPCRFPIARRQGSNHPVTDELRERLRSARCELLQVLVAGPDRAGSGVDDQRIESLQPRPAAIEANPAPISGTVSPGAESRRGQEVPEPGRPAYQGDLRAGIGPPPGQPFREERLPDPRAARVEPPSDSGYRALDQWV